MYIIRIKYNVDYIKCTRVFTGVIYNTIQFC